MKVNMISYAAMFTTLLVCSMSINAKPIAADFQSCDIDAYFIDSDKHSSNIRSAPSSQSRVIKQVDNMTTVLHITGVKDGWFQVDRVYDAGDGNDTVLFKGLGWIHHSIVGGDGTGSHGTKLFKAPTKTSKILAAVGVDDGIGFLSCKGKWAYVIAGNRDTKGWAAPKTICSNPLTNCS
jgi:SH3-like domain-containing protein